MHYCATNRKTFTSARQSITLHLLCVTCLNVYRKEPRRTRGNENKEILTLPILVKAALPRVWRMYLKIILLHLIILKFIFLIVVPPCILISTNYFLQRMHCLLKHKILQSVFVLHSPYMFRSHWTIFREHISEPC
jgi:hypothetical protein